MRLVVAALTLLLVSCGDGETSSEARFDIAVANATGTQLEGVRVEFENTRLTMGMLKPDAVKERLWVEKTVPDEVTVAWSVPGKPEQRVRVLVKRQLPANFLQDQIYFTIRGDAKVELTFRGNAARLPNDPMQNDSFARRQTPKSDAP